MPSGGGLFDEYGGYIRRMIMVMQADQVVQKAKRDAEEANERVKARIRGGKRN